MVYLVDEPAEGAKNVSGPANREEIAKAFEKFGKQAGADDLIFVMKTAMDRVSRLACPWPRTCVI